MSKADNDDVPDTDADAQIFDPSLVARWQAAGTLRITRESKENGKFAIVKFFEFEGRVLAVGGSKAHHVVVSPETIDAVIADVENRLLLSQIFACIKDQWSRLAGLFSSLPDRMSLVGELCDGMHFVPIDGDPHVVWFGLFGEGGASMDPQRAIEDIRGAGLPSVECNEVDPTRDIGDIIREARRGSGEGVVMYFSDSETGQVVLAKNKTAVYILKRMTREILKTGGYNLYGRLPARIAEAHEYHQLNTAAAARVCVQLFALSEWMMSQKIPVSCLDFIGPGTLDGLKGFANVWREFLRSGGGEEAEVVAEDLQGGFDEAAFLEAVKRHRGGLKARDLLCTPTPPNVAFFQGIQGSGKSTLGSALLERLSAERPDLKAVIVEQDQFQGHSVSCRSFMEMALQYSDADLVLVTRCNANEKHYAQYVASAHRLGARVSFLTPRPPSPATLTLAAALAGIAERGGASDLKLGSSSFSREELHGIVSKTFSEFRAHPKGQPFSVFREDACASLPEPPEASASSETMWSYVDEHSEALRSARRPIQDVVEELMPLVLDPPDTAFVDPQLSDCRLVAFYPCSPTAAADLAAAARERNPEAGGSLRSSAPQFHMTQLHVPPEPRKRKEFVKQLQQEPSKPGAKAAVQVTHLVTRLSDGHMAFRVRVPEGLWVHSGRPHITAFVPEGRKAMESNSYVYSDDGGEVKAEELKPPLEIEMVCWWT